MTEENYDEIKQSCVTDVCDIDAVTPKKVYECYLDHNGELVFFDNDGDPRCCWALEMEVFTDDRSNTEPPQEHTMSTQQLMEAIEQAHSHLMDCTKVSDSVNAQKHLDGLRGILQERAKQ